MKKILFIILLFIAFILPFNIVSAADSSNSFYINSSCNYYKNQNSVMTTNDVFNYVIKYVNNNSSYTGDTRIYVENDGYTGLGNNLGSYIIKFCAYEQGTVHEPFYFDVTINVVDNIYSDFIFDNNIYVYDTNMYSQSELLWDLQHINAIPNVDVNFTVWDSEYKFLSENEPGSYLYLSSYNSSTGLSGDHNGSIICINTSIPDVSTSSSTSSLFGSLSEFLIIILLIIGVVYLFSSLTKKKRRSRRY